MAPKRQTRPTKPHAKATEDLNFNKDGTFTVPLTSDDESSSHLPPSPPATSMLYVSELDSPFLHKVGRQGNGKRDLFIHKKKQRPRFKQPRTESYGKSLQVAIPDFTPDSDDDDVAPINKFLDDAKLAEHLSGEAAEKAGIQRGADIKRELDLAERGREKCAATVATWRQVYADIRLFPERLSQIGHLTVAEIDRLLEAEEAITDAQKRKDEHDLDQARKRRRFG